MNGCAAEAVESSTHAWLEDIKFVGPAKGVIVGDGGTILITMDAGNIWSRVKTNVSENLYAVSFFDEKIGFAVGGNGIILRTGDGGLSWRDVESPSRVNLFAVTTYGRDQAIAVGELGTVLLTGDGGKSWEMQPNITGKVLQAIVNRGGREVWVAGRGGTILKRTEPLAPGKISGPKIAPVLRFAVGSRAKPKPRTPMISVTDDGDIPVATPPKKEN